jgi:flagellar motor switch protein FliM
MMPLTIPILKLIDRNFEELFFGVLFNLLRTSPTISKKSLPINQVCWFSKKIWEEKVLCLPTGPIYSLLNILKICHVMFI